MRAYSVDLRVRIVAAYDAGDGSVRELGEAYFVSSRTVQRYRTLQRRTGDVVPRRHGGGRRRVIDAHGEQVLLELMAQSNDRTDEEYAELFAQRTGMRVHHQRISEAFRRLGISRKKKTFTPTNALGRMFSKRASDFYDACAVAAFGTSCSSMNSASILG